MRLLAGFRRGLQSSIAGWFGMDRHSLSDKGLAFNGDIVRLSWTDRNLRSIAPLTRNPAGATGWIRMRPDA